MSTTLGNVVRAARDSLGLTQAQLAAALAERGVDRSFQTVSHIETGKRETYTSELFNALSDVLDVSVEELCGAAGFRLNHHPAATAEEWQLVAMFRMLRLEWTRNEFLDLALVAGRSLLAREGRIATRDSGQVPHRLEDPGPQ